MNKKLTLSQYLKKDLSPNTADNYYYTINHFLKTSPKAKRYKYQDVVNYMEQIANQYQNPDTHRRILSAIKKYYDYLVFTDKRSDHPCMTLTVKKAVSGAIQLQDLFTGEELRLLLKRENRYKYLDVRNDIILSLLIYQGLTCDELVRLTVDSINLDECTVYIKASRRLDNRELALNVKQIIPLKEYMEIIRPKLLRTKTDRLFLKKQGLPIVVSNVNDIVKPMAVLFSGRKLTPSTIRMSVIANWLNEKKLPPEKAQKMAGHKWPSTTEKYIRTDSQQQVELINKYFPI